MKNIISIGYIGFESNIKMKERLLRHPLFENKEIEVILASDLSDLVYLYRNKKIDYLIVPSRNKNDDINVVLMQLISELNTLDLIEIGNIEGIITFGSKESNENIIDFNTETGSFDNVPTPPSPKVTLSKVVTSPPTCIAEPTLWAI